MSLYFSHQYLSKEKFKHLIFSAILSGIAVAIKPSLICCSLGTIIYCASHVKALEFRQLLLLAISLAIPCIFSILWLLVVGGFYDFYDFFSRYMLPLYSNLGRVTSASIIQKALIKISIFIPFFIIFPKTSYKTDHVSGLVCILCLGTLCSALIQGKGWDYHLVPFQLSFCLLASIHFSEAIHNSSGTKLSYYYNSLLVILIVILFSPFLLTSSQQLQTPNISNVLSLSNELRQRVKPNESIQVFDTTDGAISALYRANLHQDTRFIYDFYFYTNDAFKFTNDIRNELYINIITKKTKWLVFSSQSWPDPRIGIARLQRFQKLNFLINSSYQLAYNSNGFFIYERKQD